MTRCIIPLTIIIKVDGYRILVHYEGWPQRFDLWMDDDSEYLYEDGWCEASGHPLEPPPDMSKASECGIRECGGVGHVKGPQYSNHHTPFGCPYSHQNYNKDHEENLCNR